MKKKVFQLDSQNLVYEMQIEKLKKSVVDIHSENQDNLNQVAFLKEKYTDADLQLQNLKLEVRRQADQIRKGSDENVDLRRKTPNWRSKNLCN